MCFAMAAGMATALYGGKGDAARGKEVFEQCAMCHNADSAEKKQGPGLKGLFKRDKLSNERGHRGQYPSADRRWQQFRDAGV